MFMSLHANSEHYPYMYECYGACLLSVFSRYLLAAMGAFLSILAFFSNCNTTITAIQGGYDFLVEIGLLEDQENVRSYLKGARKLTEVLKTGLSMFQDVNKFQSGKVEAALVSLEYLDLILKQNRHDCVQHEIQKIKEIHIDLKTALNSMKVKVDNSSLNKSSAIKKWFLKKWFLKQWATTPQTEQLKAIEDKIKDAVQKGIELTTLSTSVAVNRLHILQHFNAHRIWLVTSNTINPPSPPQLHVEEELGNKFMLTWERENDDEDINFFEVCYDEDRCLSMPLKGSMCKIEIGFPQVAPGRIYTMKIRGINEGGEGKWSDSVVAQITKPTPRKPDPPELHMVSTSAIAVTVVRPKPSHESESPVTQWNVQYVIDGHDEWTTENYRVNDDKIYIFDIANLIPNQRYHFRVQAINAEGESDFSQPASIKMEYKPLPDPPEIEAISTSKVKLTIKSPENSSSVTEWKLLCIHEPPKPISYKAESGESKYSFILEDLAPNQNYYIQVQAMYAEGYSTISPVVSFKTGQVYAPSFVMFLLQLALLLSCLVQSFSFHTILCFLLSLLLPLFWHYITCEHQLRT